MIFSSADKVGDLTVFCLYEIDELVITWSILLKPLFSKGFLDESGNPFFPFC